MVRLESGLVRRRGRGTSALSKRAGPMGTSALGLRLEN